jgi:hypothetical protein
MQRRARTNTPGGLLAPWIIAVLIGCGPGPGRQPSGTAATPAGPVPARHDDRQGEPAHQPVLIGAMCSRASAGRPAVYPLFLRGRDWRDGVSETARAVARGQVRQFSVLGWTGARAGVFAVVGAARASAGGALAVGSYLGGAPCEWRATPDAAPVLDSGCAQVMGECGVAVAALEPAGGLNARPFEEDPDPRPFASGGACALRDQLVVDLDGDRAPEAFPLRDLVVDGQPAAEISATRDRPGACEQKFAQRSLWSGGAAPRAVHLLAVLDSDGDDRMELLFAFTYPDRTVWALYTAPQGAGRLVRTVQRTLPR